MTQLLFLGVLAGLDCALEAFRMLDPDCSLEPRMRDGDAFAPGDEVLRFDGAMAALLAAERTALNFLQRLSGVATRTRLFVDRVAGTGARILDTRKTTPGLRHQEKAAVVAGGGENHRIGLFDQVLLKENHFGFAKPASYEDVVRRFLRGNEAFRLVPRNELPATVAPVVDDEGFLRTFPHLHDADGFFAARLERIR